MNKKTDYIDEELKKLEGNNRKLGNTQNALKYFGKCHSDFSYSFQKLNLGKRRRKPEHFQERTLNSIQAKINNIKDSNVRLACNLGKYSGLRSFEICNIRKKDIEFTNEGVRVKIPYAKGGKSGIINCIRNTKLEQKLKEYLKNYSDDDKIFPSLPKMRLAAARAGIKLHDLRRGYSKIKLVKTMYDSNGKKVMNKPEAKEIVKENMLHSNSRTTDTYLYSKVIYQCSIGGKQIRI